MPKKGVTAALTAACKPTLVRATQEGLIVTFFFYAWGAFHYLLASFTPDQGPAQSGAGTRRGLNDHVRPSRRLDA
ncbi:MAG: hypothetical protein WDM85_15395 [Caulobacteraceae bacterium]